MYKQISSSQNPLIKQLLQLTEKSRERRKQGLFVLEGQREISLAIKGGFIIETLLFAEAIVTESQLSEITTALPQTTHIVQVGTEVYQKVAYRGSTEGMIAVVRTKDLRLEDLTFHQEHPLVLVAEAPEKPGNIGALLRTADAANLDAVIIANPRTDLYNPNILRSSVGGIFTNTIATGTSEEIIAYLKIQNIAIYSAILQESVPYYDCNFNTATALVVGTEADGLSEQWRKASTKNIHIPMQGAIDSMNVSVAAGILIFEAKRQRNFN